MVPGVGTNPLVLRENLHLFICQLIDLLIDLLSFLSIVDHRITVGVFGENMPFLAFLMWPFYPLL